MKLKFKHQKFQSDAAQAVVDVFAGQPYLTTSYKIDRGNGVEQIDLENQEFNGWKNHELIPTLTNDKILAQLQKVQRSNKIKCSEKLEGKYNLTIEMETGVGKTYTYIKTMYELNKHYGWSKFIIVVPSIAIREGVYKSFQVTEDHFAEEYGKKIRFFIYNSQRLTQIDSFASDSAINVMIINSQAFNATGKDARRIYMKLDEFRSRRPIDVIAKTNPILIIDEPQSVEGKKTKEKLKEFNPLMTLRYSATHKSDSIYNMVYRLDAVEAYNKHLVKKIAVKGISEIGNSATESYVYLENINLSKSAPTATLQFQCKGANGIRTISRKVNEGYNLYDNSNNMEQYKQGFVVSRIDGRDDYIEFVNGIKIHKGEVIGKSSEEQIRRIQIRETILSHIEREHELYNKGIKVLSLFFIDEVAKYKQYDAVGQAMNGTYADIFEEEYQDIVNTYIKNNTEDKYIEYLKLITADKTHAGYFSVDKKGKMIDSKLSRKETTSDDIDAYDLIMKNKELLLDQNPKKSPVRFIFSHSALREGWDNPNVFQICTLKQSSSDTRKRQEVGRGLRLCVNQSGERMDENVLGKAVHDVNILTIIASESYDNFAKALQSEISEAVVNRPREVTRELFINQSIKDEQGNEQVIDNDIAAEIYANLMRNEYIDGKGALQEKYFEDKANGKVQFPEELLSLAQGIIDILDTIFDENAMMPENARRNDITLSFDKDKFNKKEFKTLWEKINSKTAYVVDFDGEELIKKAIGALDSTLKVSKLYFKVEQGAIDKMGSKEELSRGESFVKDRTQTYSNEVAYSSNIKYDLVGKIAEATQLTRKDIVKILQGIKLETFNMFKDNPEEFIIKASNIINDEKATTIIEHISYNVLEDKFDAAIFTETEIKGKLDTNAMKVNRHLYDHIIYDSKNEKDFVTEMETDDNVAVYVKLPRGFYISTPVGKYNPDWAIAFKEGTVKHIYFIAETKGSMKSMTLREVEKAKISCAKKHFAAISKNDVVYDVVDSYSSLLDLITK